MTSKESANGEQRDSYIKNAVNPVPRRNNLESIVFNGIRLYKTIYDNYWISEDGDVFSNKQNRPHFIKQFDHPNNQTPPRYYKRVYLYTDSGRKIIRVHRLMMETFYGECPYGYVVDHKDNNPQNNNLSNLRYLKSSDNVRIACCGVTKEPTTEKTVTVFINETKMVFNSVLIFAEYFGLSHRQRKPHNFRINKQFGNSEYILSKYEIGKTNNTIWLVSKV